MKYSIVHKTVLTFTILFAVLSVHSSCSSHSDGDGHNHGTTSAENETVSHAHENESTATLSAEQIKSINIQIGNIEKKQLTASLKANGILKVPNQNRANVTAALGGVIKSIQVQTGATVSKGQTIATITNNAFITLQEEYLSTSAKADLAASDFARQKILQEGNASSQKTFQQAEAELKSLKAKKASLHKQLESIGINSATLTPENIQSVVSITSPIGGSVSNVMVNMGSYVEANNPIAEIVDNSQLHLDLYVYEKDLSKLKQGQTIHFTLTNNPGKEYDADVYAISNTFETNTKAIAVHAMVKGNKQGLIDGMGITALVSLENATVSAVPADAIIASEGQDYIFIVTGKHSEEEHNHTTPAEHKQNEHGHNHTASGEVKIPDGEMTFEKIPVRKGTTDIGYSEITLLKDIPSNAKIVTHGAFFILAKMTNQGQAHQH